MLEATLKELEEKISILLRRYKKMKEENINLQKECKEKEKEFNQLKSNLEEMNLKRQKAISRLNSVMKQIENFVVPPHSDRDIKR